MPRFMRALLFLTTLSLLVIPTGTDVVEAQQVPPHLVGGLAGGDAESCTVPPPTVSALSHQRCHGGQFSALQVTLEARRRTAPLMHASCAGVLGPGEAVGFRTRETLAEGRGRIGPNTVELNGRLTHDGVHTNHPEGCRVRLEGDFHRVGTVAFGRLTVDVHVDTGDDRTFRHVYCARFEATAVPNPLPGGGTAVAAEVVEAACNEEHPGRDPADNTDLHHGRCVESEPAC